MNAYFQSKHRLAAVAALALIGVVGCVESPEQTIAGRWELVEHDYNLIIQFDPGGSYRAQTTLGIQDGQWELVDDSHVATWAHPGRPKRVSEFQLEGDTLLIYSDGHAALKHVRLP